MLGLALHRQPDFVDALADDDDARAEATRDELVDEALDTLDWREDDAGRRAGLRRFKRRELLRIGARDVLGFADLDDVGRELSNLADACVEAALRSLEPTLPFAVIGMGRLGGARAVVRVRHRRDVRVRRRRARRLRRRRAARDATRRARSATTTAEGQTFRVDARLRPEGKQGPLARSLDGLRARTTSAGRRRGSSRRSPRRGSSPATPSVGAAFLDLAHDVRVPRPVPRGVAARDPAHEGAHRARAHPARRGPAVPPQARTRLAVRHRVHGAAGAARARRRASRGPRPVDAAARSTRWWASARSRADDADAPRATSYVLCERARNYRYLLTGSPGDCAAGRRRRSREARAHARLHAPPAADAARRVPPGDTAGRACSRRAGLLRPRETIATIVSWDGDEYQAPVRRARGARRRRARRGRRSSCALAPRVRARRRAAAPAASRSSSRGAASTSSASTSTRRCSRPRGRRAPDVEWVRARPRRRSTSAGTFDVVVMAGNVPLFTPPGTQAALVAGCARHVGAGRRARRRLPARPRLRRSPSTTRTARAAGLDARRALRDLGPGRRSRRRRLRRLGPPGLKRPLPPTGLVSDRSRYIVIDHETITDTKELPEEESRRIPTTRGGRGRHRRGEAVGGPRACAGATSAPRCWPC